MQDQIISNYLKLMLQASERSHRCVLRIEFGMSKRLAFSKVLLQRSDVGRAFPLPNTTPAKTL